jgi:hypothetical protein
MGARPGTLQDDPMSPFLFELVIELPIRRLAAADKGYASASCDLKSASKCYVDDGTFVINSADDIIILMDIF